MECFRDIIDHRARSAQEDAIGSRRVDQAAFGKKPVYAGEGGSIPVVGDFQRILGTPVLLMGFGLPGENAHAPNEWMSDENFVVGTRAVAAFWDEMMRK